MLTTSEAAAHLGVSRQRVIQLAERLGAIRDVHGHRHFTRAALERYAGERDARRLRGRL